MEFARLTPDPSGGWGLPMAGRAPDKVIRQDDDGTRVRISDLPESERRDIGLASIDDQHPPAGSVAGAAVETLTAAALVITYPDAEALPVTAAEVKAEAYRRIIRIIPEWKQRNLTARAAELAMKVAAGGTLTAAEQGEWDAGQVIWDKIKAVRAASDTIEAMSPIPRDFRARAEWPED